MNPLSRLLHIMVLTVMAVMPAAVFAQDNSPAVVDQKQSTNPTATPGRPRSKEAPHTINFHNKGPADITLYHVDDQCMYAAGPGSISLPGFTSQQIKVIDSDNWGEGCSGSSKNITWNAYTTYDYNGSAKNADYMVEFFHYRRIGDWVTEVDGTQGSNDGRGMLSGASCDGYSCLNHWVPGGGDTVDIYFDGRYQGPGPMTVQILQPHDQSAVPLGSPIVVAGQATARTQVSVTTSSSDDNPQPYADDNDNWNTSVSYSANRDSQTTITAKSPVDGGSSSSVTVVNIVGLTIDNPSGSDVPWSSSGIEVGGYGNPYGAVQVSVYQNNTIVKGTGCSTTVSAFTLWRCDVTGPGLAPGQDYTFVAHQTGTDPWNWKDPSVPTKDVHIDALPLAITNPVNGTHIDGDNPNYRTVMGTGTPNGQVEVWVLPSNNSCGGANNSNAVTTNISPDGKWSTGLTFSFPPGQNYTVQACQTVDGEAAPGSTSSFQSWYSLKIANPANGAVFASNTASVPMSGTGEPGATPTPVQVPPGIAVCPNPGQIAPNGSWSCPISGLTAGGSYSLSMTQSKNVQFDPSVPVQFSTANAVTIDQPAPGQQFPAQTMQVQLRGSGQSGAVLSVDVPGATSCPDDQPISIPRTGQWSCLVSDLELGRSYTASVVQGSADDIHGSMAWKDPPVTKQFSVAGFTPLIIGRPTNGQWFASATPAITATGSGQTGALLTIAVPGTTVCPDHTIQGGQWSCDISGLQSGNEYNLTATQSMEGVTDKPVSITFGIATPVVVQNPRDNAVLLPETTEITMSGTGQPGASITITTNSVPQCDTKVQSDGPAKGEWSCDILSLDAGIHYISQVVQSGDGWANPPVPRQFSVAKAAAIAIQSPGGGAMVSSNNPPDGLRVTGVGQNGATADVTMSDLPKQSVDILDGTWASQPFDLTQYRDGGTLQITATEYLDNVQQGTPAQANITVAKVATITNPSENAVEPSGPLMVAGSGQDGATVRVHPTQEGDDRGCRATVKGGAWSCVVTGLAPSSQYTLVATQSGPNAAWTDLPVIRKFSTRGTNPLFITYPGQSVPVDTPYDVRGTGQPDAEVELKSFNLISLGKTTVDGNGHWEFRNLLSSGEGCYSLTAEQTWQGYPLTNPSNVAPPEVQYSVGSQSCSN
ncbi:hypothetical protein DUT91_23135 [Phyllobacterium salinisoli]|uniref:Uncharacterized protein n=2 Tax=Phyllobacterium salinisoli TaxID=1899321 RepID=A0A368K0S1_9HYPH|nr:hypothetical protein DUT91_23135 [Phyllobacterium salinisoli]